MISFVLGESLYITMYGLIFKYKEGDNKSQIFNLQFLEKVELNYSNDASSSISLSILNLSIISNTIYE